MEAAEQTSKHDNRLLRYGAVAAIVLALICGYYLEEDWRGRHNWNNLKQQLEARGGHVDWTNYIPSPVPDDENFFGVLQMQQWFTGRGGNDLTSRIENARNSFLEDYTCDQAATVTVVKYGETIAPGDADIVLDYDAALGTLSLPAQMPHETSTNSHESEIIPLIVMDSVPLSDALTNLARQDGLKYTIDRKAIYDRAGLQPSISQRWQNVTAKQAMGELLKKYDLRFIPDSKTGVGQIVARRSGNSDGGFEPAAKERLDDLMAKAIGAVTNGFHEKYAATAMGVTLAANLPNTIKPVRVVLRSDEVPKTNELAVFFPGMANAFYPWLTSRTKVETADSNSFRMRVAPPPYMSATDYLKWSDGFAEDLNLIRESLKRPYAQMPGDYRDPVRIPIPNFICQRIMAQTLSDRAKCHLLLGQPEAAVEDLRMVRELCRVMEGRPAGRPTTLVATMIDTAITGLYAETIAEGMRLKAWREPDLIALQAQLEQINLPPLLAESFEFERASTCRMLENLTANQLAKTLSNGKTKSFWQNMKDPSYVLMKTGPRGWVYQNMSRIALLDENLLNGFDLKNRLVSSSVMKKASQETLTTLGHFSPYTFLAAVVVPNFSRATQMVARNQCLTDEAIIACALERYRLAHREYPKMLDVLTPQFLSKIPLDIMTGQPLKYRVNADGQFILYSVGWNEKDDGGVAGPKKFGTPDVELGDWVWTGPVI